MSKIQVNEIVNHFDNGAPDCPKGLTVTGFTTFIGSVSIGGTLTYEDVTNIDSVGIITAQSGIHVAGGSVGIGTDSPQQPIHLLVSNPAIRLQDTGSNTSYAQVSGNGGKLYLQADDNNVQGSSAIEFHLDGDVKALINSTGNIGIGTEIPGARLEVNSGTSSQLIVKTPGNNSTARATRLSFAFDDGEGAAIQSTRTSGGSTLNCNLSFRTAGVTNSEERLGIGTDGNVSIANGNLVFSTSGTGIDFSATADGSGTTTSELLDDYEEGTWTPQVTQGVSGTPTYSNQYGWYVKIGRLVTTYFYIRFGSSGNTGSNSIFQLGNLPFPISSVYQTVYQRGMGVSNYHSIPGFTSANVSFYGGGNSNTFASLYQGQTSVATSSAVNSQYIIGGFEYTSE